MWTSQKQNKTYQSFRFYCDSEKADFNPLRKTFKNILGNSWKISISSSTVHETTLPKHPLICG